MRDGEKVCQYVKSNISQGKLGVHGESLGGSVAAFIARKCHVDFVFVDRTFASLPETAHWMLGGPVVRWAFICLTRWTEQCWSNFFEGVKPECYKLLGCDALDKIIPELSSLKNAVAKQAVQRKLNPSSTKNTVYF